MKKIIFAIALLMGGAGMNAQTENGFKVMDVQRDFAENGFSYFTGAPILAAGDSVRNNAMTIGWGAIGNVWGMQRPTMTVYVAPKRYTHEVMEQSKYFTVMDFADPEIARYLGSKSGRDGDKAKALGLHVAYTKNGTPYYKEATSVIECEIMYAEDMKESGFRNDVPKRLYMNFSAGIHTMYIGEVVGAWRK
ncbi:MAG: flavin reductase family protein [Bacteroidales bacterium]|nr:flavin reductase family protein [Bacteroidales bacterium]